MVVPVGAAHVVAELGREDDPVPAALQDLAEEGPRTPPYTSAVSKKVTPTSSAASTTSCVASRSIRRPKLLQPKTDDRDDEPRCSQMPIGHAAHENDSVTAARLGAQGGHIG